MCTMYKVFGILHVQWMGKWIHQIKVGAEIMGHYWASNDTIILWVHDTWSKQIWEVI